MSDLAPEVQAIVDKVEKLLRLASKNPNEAEAASATAKAQELLAAYNLDMAAVEKNSGDSGKRAEENLDGGYYEWQRDLWCAVSNLNFCLYWSQVVFVPFPGGKIERFVVDETIGRNRLVKGLNRHQHRVVGRTVNVAATKAMAGYLETAVDRITKERCLQGHISLRSPYATSFREGLTDKIVSKINHRRWDMISEEKQKRQAAIDAAVAAGRASVSTATSLTISIYVDAENDANIDFVYGEGTSARLAADRARRAAADRAADDEYTRWAAANPEKARCEEEKRRREREKREAKADRKNTRYTKDLSAYYAGQDAGNGVSLDLQTEGRKAAGLLR